MGDVIPMHQSPISQGIGQAMMQDAKFFMDYSRWKEDTGAFESWEQAVKRVMDMHREKYAHRMTPELEEMIQFAEDAYLEQRVLAAQRTLQFGGDQIFKHEAKVYNCLKESTEFVTSTGVKSFEDFDAGDETTVLTHKGNWKNAVVRQYGTQQLQDIHFVKGSSTKHTVTATANHRWLLKNGDETTNLSVGDMVYKPENAFGGFVYEDATPDERMYWCYGLVYGDGTRVKDSMGVHKYSMIRLCGHDKTFAHRFEEMGFKTSTNTSLNGDFYAFTGTYLKESPNPEVDAPNLIRAFVSGYLQADGAKSGNKHGTQHISIQSSEQDHIDFIRRCFPIAGVWVVSEKDLTGQVTNFGTRPKTISFRLSDSMGSKYNTGWVVKDIQPAGTEKVWCLEVEDDKSFVLPDGIVTGNCSASYADRPNFFGQALYLLLCGVGVGFSVQRHHVAKLPDIAPRTSESKLHVIADSIQGWKDAAHVLVSSFLTGEVPFPEYQGCHVNFDYSQIRPKGSLISGGFKAPGPDGLRQSLSRCETLFQKAAQEGNRLRPIHVYDFVMHLADAVLSGGVRRSATICLFSKDDTEMLNAKTGDWFKDNAQRGRSNNSVVLERDSLTREEWARIMESVRSFGEPGFIFTDDLEFLFNPCVEIGMRGYSEEGLSGWQMCNLSEINGAKCLTREDLLIACKAASIIGTLQAGYSSFPHMNDGGVTQSIVEREALIGVSITGWMNSPDVLFDTANMEDGALEVRQVNERMAELLGINPAARTTCVKPSGNASVMLGTASGIHGEHSPRFFRNMQMNEMDEGLQAIMQACPQMVEQSVWSANGTDKMVSFPIQSKEDSVYKRDLMGVKQLDFVKKAQQHWVECGTAKAFCVDDRLRHNVSNTIPVDNWDEVEQYLFDNRQFFAGVSLMAGGGDKTYPQSPFQAVPTAAEIFALYGDAAVFASGLIVDGLHAFHGDLWAACVAGVNQGKDLSQHGSHDLLKRDWVRRAQQFTLNYFKGDAVEAMDRMTECLKDVHNLHRWNGIERNLKAIDFTEVLTQPTYTDVDTLAAQGCAGGMCEIV